MSAVILAGAALIVMPGGAAAADIVFHVPVEASNVHAEVNQLRVTCRVLTATNVLLGMANADVPVVAGAVNTTADVTVTLSTGQPRQYTCELKLRTPAGDWQAPKPATLGGFPDWQKEARPGSIAQYTYVLGQLP
ncbi:MAG: hypothetical protein AB7P67_04230 [Vicinamibacterales bacterium]